MSYDKTDVVSIASRGADGRVVQHDGYDMTKKGPIQDGIPPSYIDTRETRGRSTEGVAEMSVDVSPAGVSIGNREQTPDPYGRDGVTARTRRSAFSFWSAKPTESISPIPN
eukprot:3685911-Pyramimonas_sp.AAC.1